MHQMTALSPEQAQQLSFHLTHVCKEWWDASLSVTVSEPGKTPSYLCINDSTITPDTLFAIASNSKLFVAVALGVLVDQGKLKWSDKIQDVLPSFKLQDESRAKELTILDALSHRTGLAAHGYAATMSDSTLDVVGKLGHLEMSAGVRETFQYCNMMFTVCAAIVEEASGVRFIDFVREHILQPLAMNDTTYEPLQDAPEKLATGQYVGPDCKAPIGMAYHLDVKACNMFAGCAGLTSTPRELAVWTNWFISTHRAGQLAKALPAPQLLTKDSFDRIMQPLSIVEPGMFSGDNFSEVSTPLYSLGVYHTTYRGCRLRFHLGEDPGFQCVIGWLPDLGKGFSILSTSFPVADRLTILALYALVDTLLDLPYIDWSQRLKPGFLARISKKIPHPLPAGRKPSLPLVAYFGTYANRGYGDFSIYPLQGEAGKHAPANGAQEFYKQFDADVNDKNPPLVDKVSLIIDLGRRLWCNRAIVLVHSCEDIWLGTSCELYRSSLVGHRPSIMYGESNAIRLSFKLGEGRVLGFALHGIWGKPANVSEAEDFEEVVFTKV